jgi:hypothetical protein
MTASPMTPPASAGVAVIRVTDGVGIGRGGGVPTISPVGIQRPRVTIGKIWGAVRC